MRKNKEKPELKDSFFFKDKSDSDLILYNDNYNEFDFVIDSLMQVCGHQEEQATQCAYIAHYKGKSRVKKGTYSILKRMKSLLTDKGLTASIE
ncbi:MAG: ATP-dependent Clp protease adaptor ClpS [Bacteroidetes bacterium]|nr:MAG: ATP-dependent Clp protease adaptor ClpS [Bacteroidota bacterium]